MHKKLKNIEEKFKAIPKYPRIGIGVLFIIGGILGFLPILGFWMLPLGLLILSPDFRWARRIYLSIVYKFRNLGKNKTKP